MVEGDQERPRTLHELCELREESQHEIELECVYCLCSLTRVEVYDFARRDFKLVYRRGNPYGVCEACLRFYCKIRKYRRYNYSIYGATLERRTKKQLLEILIRCYVCQKPLCPIEKQRHVDEGKRFHNIADQWTGRCMQCWIPSASELETEV
ncbi:E6 [Macaca fascicularis papillomavirus 10]|uniref:Protein E6 n=1 Tax=Macaca fascicularis papillomavirus 10 TaxID=524653 RepID=C3RUC1_RHPV1|nr:E6 [Macaca fascicularis papillomavirus 10]